MQFDLFMKFVFMTMCLVLIWSSDALYMLENERKLIQLHFIVKSGYQLNLIIKGGKMVYSEKIIRCTYLVVQSHYDKKKSIKKNIIL